MKAVVTGGAGFIGHHLVKRLVLDGWFVHVIDNLSTETEITLNGTTVSINGKVLPRLQIAAINILLKKNNIIGAPGKALKISGVGNYTLGYSNGKAHLGTWIVTD